MKHIYTFICMFLLSGATCAYGETISYENGDKYVGEVSNGLEHGYGTFIWGSGDKYIGEWKNGNMHGYGTYIYANGHKYIGEWKKANMHGQGTFTWPNGEKYVGEWKNGQSWNGINYRPDGTVKGKLSRGVFEAEGSSCVKERKYTENGKSMIDCEYASGDRYVGGVENGAYNGHGTYIWAYGDKYIGEYKDGLLNGYGSYTHADGSKYVGEYKDGNRWNGITYNADGTVRGTYSNGEWIAK